MMTEHTPGPWLEDPPDKITPEWWVFANHAPEGEKLVAMVPSQANARLIAAAPDLLEALQEIAIAPCISALLGEETDGCGCPGCRARATIAKAEGKE